MSDLVSKLRRWAAIAENHYSGTAPVDYVLLREAADEIERLRAERDRLDSYLDHTADGKLVCECEKFFCPRCAGELRVVIDIAYCDDCPNPDDYGVPPMPWSLSMAYSTREAAQAAERNTND